MLESSKGLFSKTPIWEGCSRFASLANRLCSFVHVEGAKSLRGYLLALALIVGACISPLTMSAQDVEDFYARMLEQEVEVVNPVKRPVLGLGVGVLMPMGDIKYLGDNALASSWAARLNVSTLVGRSKQVKLNVSVLYGMLEGEDRSKSFKMNRGYHPEVEDITWYPNTAFSTEVIEIGFSAEYNFWHLLGTQKTVRPYISLGAGLLLFTPKMNYKDHTTGDFFHYWDDGTVRLEPQSATSMAQPIKRDRHFETDIKRSNIFSIKSIPPATGVIPVELGADVYVSDRVVFRPFVALHCTFTDLLDGFDKTVAGHYGFSKKMKYDMFIHTGISFQFDFFSQAESFIVDKVFADIEDFDYEVFFTDQDSDGIFDHLDQCPDTPPNTPVDTVGCPRDSDHDGVPDYMDKELNTPFDTPVDEQGVSLDDAGRTLPKLKEQPVLRKDVKILPVSMVWNKNYKFDSPGIPEKFLGVDIDGDGQISYEEVVRAVDDYFTGRNDFTPDDIYELNAYFFSQ